MRCDDVRAALSARLDGEELSLPGSDLDRHLGECAGCRAWLADAQRLTRMVRVQSVDVPDLTAQIFAAIQADGTLPVAVPARPGARGPWARDPRRPGTWR